MHNKCSAVAEMVDRGHNRHAPKRWGLLYPVRGGGAGLLPYIAQVASSSIQPFSDAKELGEIQTGSPPTGAPNRGGVG